MHLNKVSMIHNDDFSHMVREGEETNKFDDFDTPEILLSD